MEGGPFVSGRALAGIVAVLLAACCLGHVATVSGSDSGSLPVSRPRSLAETGTREGAEAGYPSNTIANEDAEAWAASHRQLDERIIGGGPVVRTQVPYQAAITVSFVNASEFCGGTLIHPQFVLSAAHCLFDEGKTASASDITIRLGSTSESGGQLLNVVKMWRFPGYKEVKGDPVNDVVLFKLNKAVAITDNVVPIKLVVDDKPLTPSSDLVISGWGYIDTKKTPPQSLLAATIDHLPNGCGKYGPRFKPDVMVCAGCSAGGVDTCQGDSGGPATASSSSKGCPILVGITSFGASCAVKGFPGIYTRVQTFVDWVEKQAGVSFRTQYPLSPTSNCETCGGQAKRPCGLVPSFDLNRCKVEAWMSYAFTFSLKPCISGRAFPAGPRAPVEAYFSPASFGSFIPNGDVYFLQGLPGGSTTLTVGGVNVVVSMTGQVTSVLATASENRYWSMLWAPDINSGPKICTKYYSYAAVFVSTDKKLVQVSYPASYSSLSR